MPAGVYPRRPLADRLAAKLQVSGECLIWTGATNGAGYGMIASGGRPLFVHRVAWELANGPIPDGMCVCHRCDVKLCAKHEHLFVGSQNDNLADMRAKGRAAIGEKHGNAILTREKAQAAKALLAAGFSQAKVSRQLGVSKGCIQRIADGTSLERLR